MASAMPELRTPVMILVEVSWQDQSGVWQNARLRMEDKSAGGACLRSKAPIEPESKIKVHWRFDQFAGIVKYCRKEDREYLIGIQRGLIDLDAPAPQVPHSGSKPSAVQNPSIRRMDGRPATSEPANDPAPFETDHFLPEIPRHEARTVQHREFSKPNGHVAQAPFTAPVQITVEEEIRQQTHTREGPGSFSSQETNIPRQTRLHAEATPKRRGDGKERKIMANKWLQRAPWNHKENVPVPATDQSTSDLKSFTAPKESSMPQSMQNNDKASGISAREVPVFQVELLPMEDIYRTAGIVSPRKGYSVTKVVEMLNSEHIRSLSKETKRAALLMALDAAGVSIEQVQRDAKSRQSALDAYESEQKKQAEAEWARKAEEISHIQAELESIKAHYSSRISRNMEALARDKARFNAWVTTKEQEAQSMAEAVDLCTKSQASTEGVPARELGVAAVAGPTGTPSASNPRPL